MASRRATLRVESLSADYWDREVWINVVNRVSFTIHEGETLGLAGESGCGKSTTAFALFGYRRTGSRFREGQVLFKGQDLLSLDESELRPIRGHGLSLVPQNPAGALTPSMRVGDQVKEAMQVHRVVASHREARQRTMHLLTEVGLPDPEILVERYPHQLSGGQQQRVIIAMALACRPDLVVLDEPTSALDVTIQARILKLLMRLQEEHGMSVLFVTHDLGVLAQISDRLAVMYAGELAEVAPTDELFKNPRHPYTQGLIAAVPRVGEPGAMSARLRGLLRREELPESGCRFAPRCRYRHPFCFEESQRLAAVRVDHRVACWRWESIAKASKKDGGFG